MLITIYLYQTKVKAFSTWTIKDGYAWLELRSHEIQERVYAAAVASRGPVVPPPGQEAP